MSRPTRHNRRVTRHNPYISDVVSETIADDGGNSALDQSIPENWTVSKLREELKTLGISVAPRSRHSLLVKQYKQTVRQRLCDSRDPDATRAVNDSGRGLASHAQAHSPIVSPSDFKAMQETISGLLSSVKTLTTIVATQNQNQTVDNSRKHQGNDEPGFTLFSRPSDVHLECTGSDGNSATLSPPSRQGQYLNTKFGFSAESLPFIETVQPSIRRQIQDGKNVNLATLLIPYYNGPQTEKASTEKQDPRLLQSLSLPQFIQAFGIYKNIMCQAHPHRREELDLYEREIIDMASRYNGKGFYDYHKMFSAQAAAHLIYNNIKVDWSIRNNKLFCAIFANYKASQCSVCESSLHQTSFCPQADGARLNSSRHMKGNNNNTDVLGRARVLHNGKEICNNFNSARGCSRVTCKNIHACLICKGEHTQQKCKSAKNSQETGQHK